MATTTTQVPLRRRKNNANDGGDTSVKRQNTFAVVPQNNDDGYKIKINEISQPQAKVVIVKTVEELCNRAKARTINGTYDSWAETYSSEEKKMVKKPAMNEYRKFQGFDLASIGGCCYINKLHEVVNEILMKVTFTKGTAKVEDETLHYILYKFIKGISVNGKPSPFAMIGTNTTNIRCSFKVAGAPLDLNQVGREMVSVLGKIGVSTLLWSRFRLDFESIHGTTVLAKELKKILSNGQCLGKLEHFLLLHNLGDPFCTFSVLQRNCYQESRRRFKKSEKSLNEFKKNLKKSAFWLQNLKEKYCKMMATCLRAVAAKAKQNSKFKLIFKKLSITFRNMARCAYNLPGCRTWPKSKNYAQRSTELYKVEQDVEDEASQFEDLSYVYLTVFKKMKNKSKIRKELAATSLVADQGTMDTGGQGAVRIVKSKVCLKHVSRLASKLKIRLPKFRVKTRTVPAPAAADNAQNDNANNAVRTEKVLVQVRGAKAKNRKTADKSQKSAKASTVKSAKVKRKGKGKAVYSMSIEKILRKTSVISLSFMKKMCELYKIKESA